MQYFRSEELKQELNDADNLTEERLDELLDTFLRDFEAGAPALGARGWPDEFASYKVAKAAVNAYSRIRARRHPELRAPRLRQDRHDQELGAPHARGGGEQCREGGTAPRRWADRRLLRDGEGGVVPLTVNRDTGHCTRGSV